MEHARLVQAALLTVALYALLQNALAFLAMFGAVALATFVMLPSRVAALGVVAAWLAAGLAAPGSFPVCVLSGAQFGAVAYLLAAAVQAWGASRAAASLIACGILVGVLMYGLHGVRASYHKKNL